MNVNIRNSKIKFPQYKEEVEATKDILVNSIFPYVNNGMFRSVENCFEVTILRDFKITMTKGLIISVLLKADRFKNKDGLYTTKNIEVYETIESILEEVLEENKQTV